MKKFSSFLFIVFLALSTACRKRVEYVYLEPPKALSERLPGDWKPSFVTYSTQVDLSSQGLPPVTVSGITENPNGNMRAEREPKNMNFQLQFSASVDLGFGLPIPIPVNINITGTYLISNDEKTVTLTQSNGSTLNFRVLTNEFNVQVWRTTYPFQAPLLGSLPIDMIITLVKTN
ncbi:hypothetical protein JCM31826_09320 [Thermaurantimonas aggregans]|uniref:Uncharacterized protein n=1 Tax=Thermaurantimonas aggregans TaxID=2173829 RepID=A0A401XKD8_9FLAO|nr:hypothetical protein [Thermaurantimonas aggregans]MCX8148360.1 hypothetical protein [Thermaurantimonas aggregans]GCD77450.1 hypothetical protein JCM31826_09320 [Thermaurantimonas aggregans]